MSVLIKGMDMPKTGVYVLAVDNTGVDKTVITIAERTQSGKIIPRYVGEAVPVPTPHGRLIDVDALKDKGADVHEDIMCCGYAEDTIWGFSYDMIDNAPTIIEAEGEDE